MDLAALNRAPRKDAVADLLQCCASAVWAEAVADRRPFVDTAALLTTAADVWWTLGEEDWLQAFAAHPRIGEDSADSGRHGDWSRLEQSGAAGSSDLAALRTCNQEYERRFGWVFLIRASGRSAAEMLAACRERLEHDADQEFLEAAAEQEQITEIRLRRLLGID